ncbi:arabinan endo-1,5-alpha-L-arabinosidase [Cytophagaceae bacterium DM2B3-1]|uniref:Arabinan endo-1,5-alpha-L-arabinosidase n=1 Tax=Xanthocytophaga flava TaxID=3048013 RepID=A0ABT7CM72_9BACT|nr:arabinan endo-1,5-alpha-L-arabinosidase [Xanthocytophaga flavus]MDJ1494092.1 arabinan endo-1,5-alpha-L-arabinosidase [Xanthocytophaga flavus]
MTLKIRIIFLFWLVGSFMRGFAQTQTLDPQIKDDYTDIAGLDHYKEWAGYNVHDPSCIKVGEYYYVYSTDAIYFPRNAERKNPEVKQGNIQVRRSKDLVHWEFLGWALDKIPDEAIQHIRSVSGGKEPQNVWAPYVLKQGNIFRMYYAVSLFGKKTSYIGLATSTSPTGPWTQAGDVVKTDSTSLMNAIDPTIVDDVANKKQWMLYGSYFGGLYCVELNPVTGLPVKEGDLGHLVVNRADTKSRVVEAPEVIYNPQFKKYYLFVSYDALFTHYNVRVGRADKPEGPYCDRNGRNMADTTNNYPILTYAYRFQNHAGWAGVGHCSVINDNGAYYMLHQGRLAPTNQPMVLHVRKMFWTKDGWPVVSPERYANVPQRKIEKKELIGEWEQIELTEIADKTQLWQGQIRGGWKYDTTLFNNSKLVELLVNGNVKNQKDMYWKLSGQSLEVVNSATKEKLELLIWREWDWENKRPTIVFSGINKQGLGIWGKKKTL